MKNNAKKNFYFFNNSHRITADHDRVFWACWRQNSWRFKMYVTETSNTRPSPLWSWNMSWNIHMENQIQCMLSNMRHRYETYKWDTAIFVKQTNLADNKQI